ncbi:MAG TPA: hypothetical protein VIJ85_03760 [Rhizomicrobium sp.]
MTAGPQQSTSSRLTAGVIFAGFVFSLAVNLPGHLSYDSVVQLLEGRTGLYAGWHPPVTSWLLGVTDAILPGTALFVVLNTLLIFGALWAMLRLATASSWTAVLLAALFAFTPQYLMYPGIVWKDILFAAATVSGYAALGLAASVWTQRRLRYAWSILGLVLLVVAALARQNGIVMLLGGVAAFGWIAARHEGATRRTIAIYGGSALLAAIVTLTAANVALGTHLVRESGTARQLKLLQMYDIVGMLSAQSDLRLDSIDAAYPVLSKELRTDGVRLYTPQRNDPLAASAPLQAAMTAAPSDILRDQWIGLIVQHPWLYLKTRSDIFAWVFLTPRIDLCLPFYAGVSGPQETLDELDMTARWDDRDQWLQYYGDHFLGWPPLQHGIFAIFSAAAGFLLLRRRRPADIAIGMMQIAALAFTATFFLISIACDYRYLYSLDLAAMTGWFYLALDWQWPEEMLARSGLFSRWCR